MRDRVIVGVLLVAGYWFAPASPAQKAADSSVQALCAAQGESLLTSADMLASGELKPEDHAAWLTKTNDGIVGRTYVPAQAYLSDAKADTRELIKRTRALGKALKGKK